MSEHIRPEWLGIEHQDTEACIVINGLMRAFSTADSAYWLYPERYQMFNHIVKWHEGSEYDIWFGAEPDDYDALHEAGVTQITAPYPNEEVIALFWQVEMAHYDVEMKQLETTGEL